MQFVLTVLLFAQVLAPGDFRNDIVTSYQRSLDALTRGDADAAMSIDTSDWVSITNGQAAHTKSEMAPQIRRDVASMKPPAGWTAFWQPDYERTGTGTGIQVYNVDRQGNTAIVLSLVGSTRTQAINGSPHQVWTGSHVRDTWILTSDGWKRRKHEKLTINERLVDGRP